MRYLYRVVVEKYPCVVRNCAKCGTKKPFLPTNQIRINAQKKMLDVWLIHQCCDCGQTWNMEVYARVSPKQLERGLYDRLIGNDEELIRELAFDAGLHARKGAALCLDTMRYRIEGERVETSAMEGVNEIEVVCEVALGVKVSAVLREILGISGKRYDGMVERGEIRAEDGVNLKKARMGKECRVWVEVKE